MDGDVPIGGRFLDETHDWAQYSRSLRPEFHTPSLAIIFGQFLSQRLKQSASSDRDHGLLPAVNVLHLNEQQRAIYDLVVRHHESTQREPSSSGLVSPLRLIIQGAAGKNLLLFSILASLVERFGLTAWVGRNRQVLLD